MHYPLHITVLFASLLLLQDAQAAKSGLNPEVLTSFAKNVASVLSTTLLGDHQDPPTNQSSTGLPKRIQEAQTPVNVGQNESESSEISSKDSFGRYARYTRDLRSSSAKGAFLDAYANVQPQYPKYYYSSQAFTPYKYTANADAQVSHNQINAEVPENINSGIGIRSNNIGVHDNGIGIQNQNYNRDNSIELDTKAPLLQYSNGYSNFRYNSAEPKYELDPVNRSTNPANQYAQYNLQPEYHRLPSEAPDHSEQSVDDEAINPNAQPENANAQTLRITRRPFYLNYHPPLHHAALHHDPAFHEHSGFYRNGPTEGQEGQPVAPNSGQEESNPTRLVDDQNQGQTVFAGYDYGPHFHHKPYHNGFYHGFPGFYPHPFNHTFNPGNPEQGGGNGTGSFGPPYGPPFYHGPRFGPFRYHQPFYPNFHGYRQQSGPQNPSENQGNAEQTTNAEGGQGNGNGTGNHPPFGYPPYGPYGPFYGGFGAYPLVPFHAYRFGYGFHDHLFPKIKAIPYLNFYPGGYHHLPLAHWFPYGGFYPYNNNRRPTTMPEKPGEKAANENAEAGAPASEAEMLSESNTQIVQAPAGSSTKESNKETTSDQPMNQFS